VTEGVENGLSLQEYISNEVWCSLSIVNIPALPFEDNKIYVIVFDNDLNKPNGKDNLIRTVTKLSQLNNKRIFYLLPREDGKDANDLLKEKIETVDGNGKKQMTAKLQQLLFDTPLTPVPINRTARTNKGETRNSYVPVKPDQLDSIDGCGNGLEPKFFYFLNMPYDNDGIARRFLARYGCLHYCPR
jgi:hypothetical protein